MTSEIFLLNTFFAYFFAVGDWLVQVFAYVFIVVIVIGLIKKHLTTI